MQDFYIPVDKDVIRILSICFFVDPYQRSPGAAIGFECVIQLFMMPMG
jgi:hypothetical protein